MACTVSTNTMGTQGQHVKDMCIKEWRHDEMSLPADDALDTQRGVTIRQERASMDRAAGTHAQPNPARVQKKSELVTHT